MYTYGSGSPATYGGFGAPRPIDVMGPGYGLPPAAEGGVVRAQKSWRNVRKQFKLPPGYHGLGTYLQMDHPLSYAPRFSGLGAEESSGSGWADVINATIAGTAAIFQLSTQAKLAKQQQHQIEREAAHRRELEKTQAMYINSGSVVPAQGSVVTIQSQGAPGFGMGRMAAIAGVAIAGGALLYFMRKGRRRR